MNCEQKYNMASGIIGKSFYEDYIKDEVSKATQAKFEAILETEDDFVEYYRVGIDNPNDRAWEFSSLWFFDINLEKGYMPVFKSGVNTSSCLAMVMCGMDRDEDEGEDNERTLEELLEYAPNGSEKAKETLKKILLMKKEEEKVIESFYICRECGASYSNCEVDCVECDGKMCCYIFQAETFEEARKMADKYFAKI